MGTSQDCRYLYEPDVRGAPALPRWLSPARLADLLQLWQERARQRRQLAQLDDRMLRDIGVGHADAYRESQKWFWQD